MSDMPFVTFSDKALLLRDKPSKTGTVDNLWHGIPEEERVNYTPRSGRRIRLLPESGNIFSRWREPWEAKFIPRCKEAFTLYRALSARHAPFCGKPKLNGTLDVLRWWLHLKLLRWGVIL